MFFRQIFCIYKPFVSFRDGVKRAGFYCALSICLRQMTHNNEVDVFNAVRTVKQNRPSLVNRVRHFTDNLDL